MKKPKFIENETAFGRLSEAFERDALSHLTLLTGDTAENRKKAAEYLATAILCEGKGEKPCGKCAACKKIKDGIHSDVYEIAVPDKKKFIPLDLVKEEIISRANIVPGDGPYNIFIIHEASDLREEGANALLKTIEEPMPYTRFIMTAPNKISVLNTITSRAREFSLGPERENITSKTAQNAEEIVLDMGRALFKKNEYELMLATAPLTKNRHLAEIVIERFKTVIRDAMCQGAPEQISGLDKMALSFSQKFDINTLQQILDHFDRCLENTEKNCNENLLLCILTRGLAEAVGIK